MIGVGEQAEKASETASMRLRVRLCLPLLLLPNCGAVLAESLLPAPPACAKVLEHPDRGWLAFFDSHSAALTARARVILEELAAAFREDHGRFIGLNGNTDSAETTAEDRGLGLRRAEAVAEALREAGVTPRAIYTKDVGQTTPLGPQLPDHSEPQNRRVDLIPMGMQSENRGRAIRDCKAWIKASCFGSLAADQQTLCIHALNILVPAE